MLKKKKKGHEGTSCVTEVYSASVQVTCTGSRTGTGADAGAGLDVPTISVQAMGQYLGEVQTHWVLVPAPSPFVSRRSAAGRLASVFPVMSQRGWDVWAGDQWRSSIPCLCPASNWSGLD